MKHKTTYNYEISDKGFPTGLKIFTCENCNSIFKYNPEYHMSIAAQYFLQEEDCSAFPSTLDGMREGIRTSLRVKDIPFDI